MTGALGLIVDYESAVRAECLRYGRSVDDIGLEFTWNDVIAICESTEPGNPLHSAMYPDSAGWTNEAMLMADMVDSLRVLMWQNGSGKKRDYPKPIPRPGVKDDSQQKFSGEAMEITDMQAWLDRKRAGAA